MISPQRRREIIDALRRGTVPQRGLDAFAVGTNRFAPALDSELSVVAAGGAGFKAIRGEYGSGKTFTVRWLAERARSEGFATAEVQISEGETPLHHLETVYRRLCERLTTSDTAGGALRSVVDSWFYALHEDVVAAGSPPGGPEGILAATEALAEQRLGTVAARAPALAAVLRGYRRALADGDEAQAEGLLAWLGGQPHVAAAVKRAAGIRGDLDHDGALAFLAGLLTILKGAGYAGLLLVLDEVETLQRVRSDARDRALNALRQLIDEVDQGRYPGLYLMITGTPAFFDGPQGAQRLAPLAQRFHTDFTTDARFDNARAVQLTGSAKWAAGCETSTPTALPTRRASKNTAMTPTSSCWPRPSPATSAARLGSPPGSSSRSSSGTSSTASTSSRISTPAATTASPLSTRN
jgi:hypothetical protein